MLRIGIIGLGVMGKTHFNCYDALENVKVAAVFDIDQDKLTGKGETGGNTNGVEDALDFTGVNLYSDFDQMLAKENLDAVSITLPTYLHPDYTIKALQAGVNVLCEKPMALDQQQCQRMIKAAEAPGKILQIGHCIRFWPEYAAAKQIIDSGKYGKVLVATFQRFLATPTWSWDHWMLDGQRSGGASLDLHIHDTDLIHHWFGMPEAVFSTGTPGISGQYDHIATQYLYDDQKVITAEGGWLMAEGFGFQISFHVVLEKATIIYDCTRKPALKLCDASGDTFTPQVQDGNAYSLGIAHFVQCITSKELPQITIPQQAADALRIVEAEKTSARTGEKVPL